MQKLKIAETAEIAQQTVKAPQRCQALRRCRSLSSIVFIEHCPGVELCVDGLVTLVVIVCQMPVPQGEKADRW